MGDHQRIGGVTPFLKIQEGVWADVYKAYDASLERYVLLKVLNRASTQDRALADQFESEARLMARIQHPNIVAILSFDNTEESVYFTAEFIEGKSLKTLIEEQGKLPPQVALQILESVVLGLHAAHKQGILHRDLKPANVLISFAGHVKLTDFGLASLNPENKISDLKTSPDKAVRGTLAYLAPEHVFESPPSEQSDLFSLGATFYEMLTGRQAFRGNTTSEIFDNILHYDPILLISSDKSIPHQIAQLCDRLLQKNPEDRYRSAEELISILGETKKLYPNVQDDTFLQSYIQAPAAFVPFRLPDSIDLPKNTEELEAQAPAPTQRNYKAVAVLVVFLVVAGISILALIGEKAPSSPPISIGTEVATTNVIPENERLADSLVAPSLISSEVSSAASSMVVASPTTKVLSSDTSSDKIPANYEEEQALTEEPVITEATVAAPEKSFSESSKQDTVLTASNNSSELNAQLSGELNVLCTPWCEVRLGGHLIGKAPPVVTTMLPAGVHVLELTNPYYPVHRREIKIRPGISDTLRVPFKDLVATIELEVVPWAEVFIDSVSYGQIPPKKTILLAAGEYLLTLKNDDLGSWNKKIIVAAGEKLHLPLNLEVLLNN